MLRVISFYVFECFITYLKIHELIRIRDIQLIRCNQKAQLCPPATILAKIFGTFYLFTNKCFLPSPSPTLLNPNTMLMVVHLMPTWATPKIPTLDGEGGGGGGVNRRKILSYQLLLGQMS